MEPLHSCCCCSVIQLIHPTSVGVASSLAGAQWATSSTPEGSPYKSLSSLRFARASTDSLHSASKGCSGHRFQWSTRCTFLALRSPQHDLMPGIGTPHHHAHESLSPYHPPSCLTAPRYPQCHPRFSHTGRLSAADEGVIYAC